MKHASIIIRFMCCITLLTSCDPNRVYEENKAIEGDAWKVSEPLNFEAEITDTTQAYNVYLNVRNASHYGYRNLYMLVATTFPNEQVIQDTVQVLLANEAGEWLGSGMGDIWDSQVMWKHAVRFPMAGKYRFRLEQAMRVDPLPFIMEVGIRIEKFERP
ncbi:MAG: gliding motility lipoprotein GldH [Flavobacteriales bacterium]|nr:gliding motility lipoprotein GldH [Flavobacteriales bacterium]